MRFIIKNNNKWQQAIELKANPTTADVISIPPRAIRKVDLNDEQYVYVATRYARMVHLEKLAD